MPFPQRLLDFVLQPSVLGLAFLALLALFIIISVILVYHWKRYSLRTVNVVRFTVTYFMVAAVLLVMMAVAFVLYVI